MPDLNLSPVAVVFVVGQDEIIAARARRDDIVRLRVGGEIEEEHDGVTFAVREVEASDKIDKIEAGS